MPRFDPDTIAALAEGRLSPEEAARVEQLIASDPAARAEWEIHRTALDALSSATSFSLTEVERAGLRASVADAIGLVDASPVAAAAPRRVPWGALGIAAASLAGLVAFVPLAGLLTTAGDDDAATAFAPTATAPVSDGTGTAEATTKDDESTPLSGDATFDASQEAPGDDVAGFGSTTMAAQAPTTSDTTLAGEAVETTIAGVEELAPAAIPVELATLLADPDAVGEVAAAADTDSTCAAADALERTADETERWTFEYVAEDGTSVVVFFDYDASGVPGPFAAYTGADCTRLAVVPPAP